MRRANRDAPLFFSRTYDFLERYLPKQVGRSPHTVDSYRDALSVFRRFVRDERGLTVADMEFGDCTRDLVLSFVEHLREQGCSAGTCNQRLAAIRSYLWFAADRDVAIQSVALSVSRIPPVKGPERIKEKLSEPALAAILSQPDPSTRKGVRDRAMLVLLYDSGIRLSELLGLLVGDVRLGDDPRIYVTGKGSKGRAVAITPATADHLSAHLGCMHGANPDPGDPLFFTMRGGSKCRMSASNVQRIVQGCADRARDGCADVPAKVHPHMFRRTRATDLYQSGVALELVSRILGHSSMETTKIYAKPSMDMMRSAMESARPPVEGERPAWVGNEEEMARLCGLR